MLTLKASTSLKPASRKLRDVLAQMTRCGNVQLLGKEIDLQSDGKSENGITAQDLNRPSCHVDFRSTEVGSLEALDVASTGHLGSFDLSRMDNQSQCRFDIFVRGSRDLTKSSKADFGFFNLVSADA
jgi:hypothetical protein